MKFDKYVSSVSNIFVQNRLLKFVIVVLAVLAAFLVIKITELALNERVVLVPVGLNEKAEVGSSQADETYLSAMGVYAATLLYSTTPVSVEAQYKLLLKLFSTDAYTKYSESLMTTAASHAKNAVSFSFKIEKIKIETSPNRTIKMAVNVDKYIFGKKSTEIPERRELNIEFRLVNGQFYITSLEEDRII